MEIHTFYFPVQICLCTNFITLILFLHLFTAIIVCVIWGLSLIVVFSYHIAKLEKLNPFKVMLEHLSITIIVVIVAHYIGDVIAALT
jgi:VIT1/CCC1 family predicted Fe2+/Mn2+ transporter